MKTQKFQRKPFIVDCVQVTEENMEEVAKWCKGTITTTDSKIAEQLKRPVRTWIQVETQQPMSDRQKQAFVGDWLLYANNGFKIYTPKAFERTFEEVAPSDSKTEAANAIVKDARTSVVPSPKVVANQQKVRHVQRSSSIPEVAATSGVDVERIQAQLAEAGLKIVPADEEVQS